MQNLSILPKAGRPRLAETEFRRMIEPYGVDLAKYPIVVCGMRGFFAKETGASDANERDIYDDALFLWAPDASTYLAFNGNTDPSKLRLGLGAGAAKGTAVLQPGVWYSYRFSEHVGSKTRYEAICQRAAEVVVTRDGTPPYEDQGWFGINIHRGGNYTTSSEGCQTIPPVQWPEFIEAAHTAGHKLFGEAFRKRVIPYVLVDRQTVQASKPSTTRTPRDVADQLRSTVIAPTLRRLGLWSEAAENLLLGTACVESDLEHRTQIGGGPALGLFQMEPRTHDDIWSNYLAFRRQVANNVASFATRPTERAATDMENNDAYACAMARIHYLRVPGALPGANDVRAMAGYWKRHYNTPLGAGTEQKYLDAWARFQG
jgi:hypothetical protein